MTILDSLRSKGNHVHTNLPQTKKKSHSIQLNHGACKNSIEKEKTF